MSQIFWMISLIPQALLHLIVNLMLLASIVGLIASFLLTRFELVSKYKYIIYPASIFLLVLGAYFKGVLNQEDKWQQKIIELEQKVAVAEQKSKETNVVIKEKIVVKLKKIKEVQYKTKEVIKEKEKIINAECKVSKEAIDILNAAATGVEDK